MWKLRFPSNLDENPGKGCKINQNQPQNHQIIKKYNEMLWNPSKSITCVEKNKQVENRWFKDIPCESDSFDKIIQIII